MLESLFNKAEVLRACKEDSDTCVFLLNLQTFSGQLFRRTSASKHYLKRGSSTGVSCEFCELFKNTYFLEDLQTAASETPVQGSFLNKVASLTA